MKTLLHFCLGCSLVLGLGSARVAAFGDAEKVIVIVNQNDPDSIAIGQHYIERRSIPERNVIAIDAPKDETISLKQYVDRIHNPILDALLAGEWISGVKAQGLDQYGRSRLLVSVHNIRFLVTTKGVPLRFNNEPELFEAGIESIPKQFQVNRASVDSELALLAGPPNLSMTAFVPNPYFEKDEVSPGDANRVIKVSRLDGPTRKSVLSLIDRSIEAEQIGLMGRAYIDSGGPHKQGDQWFAAAAELARSAYFDTDMESTKRLMDFEDRLDAPAIYMGWYRTHAFGPWRALRWSVPPGAIGFHLHSFSATTVRSTTKGWLGPLVEQGYCATFGNVFEPYLEFTHRPHVFLEHVLDGGNFGDAVMKANRALSWQTVAIGDPLYRPFKLGLKEQLESKASGPFSSYIALRDLNRLIAETSVEEALPEARIAFMRLPSLPLAYRLAQMYDSLDQVRQAKEALKFVRYISTFPNDEKIVVAGIADLLSRHGDSKLGFSLYESMLRERDLPKNLRIALLERGSPVAARAGEAVLSSRWKLEAGGLKNPPSGKK